MSVDKNRAKIKELKEILGYDVPDKEDRYDAMEIALKYIADEAGPADAITIKRVANIALGREQS